MFIIKRAASMLFSLFAVWVLPYNTKPAISLMEEEQQLAFFRVHVDSSSVVNEKFNLRRAIGILKEPTSWVIFAIGLCLAAPMQSVSLFLPVIVKQLGYSTFKSNLCTVAPNRKGAVMLLVLAFTSDYTRLRSPFVALRFAFTYISFIIFAAVNLETQLHIAYCACLMMTWATSVPGVNLDVWYNNNIADEIKRILLTSIRVPVANMMGVVR
jgi:hypothetical protein